MKKESAEEKKRMDLALKAVVQRLKAPAAQPLVAAALMQAGVPAAADQKAVRAVKAFVNKESKEEKTRLAAALKAATARIRLLTPVPKARKLTKRQLLQARDDLEEEEVDEDPLCSRCKNEVDGDFGDWVLRRNKWYCGDCK